MDRYKLEQTAKSGANWFYWISALSAINSLSFWLKANWSFFAGLGLTQIADAIAVRLGSLGVVAAVCIDLAAVLAFGLIGYLARGRRGAFIVGMALYALDGLLLLALGAYLAGGFHVFALVFIFKGWQAAGQLAQLPALPIRDVVESQPESSEPESYFDAV